MLPQPKFIENHETQPYYQRPALFSKVKEILAEVPHLKQVMLKQPSFNFDSSWFSILWTCQRVCVVPDLSTDDESSESLELGGQQHSSTAGDADAGLTSSAVTSIQFLAIFRFRPDQA